MAGFSVSYISSRLAVLGITHKTKNLILDFLNAAPSAAAIAGIEPKEGPVFDDPDKGYGDQVRANYSGSPIY